MKNFYLGILLLCLAWHEAHGEGSRLNRIMRLYDGNTYQVRSRFLHLSGGYLKTPDDPQITSSSFGKIVDTVRSFSRTYGAIVGYTNQTHAGYESGQQFQHIGAHLSAASRSNGYSLRSSNQGFDRRDTIGEKALLLGQFSRNLKRFKPLGSVFPSFFFQLNGRAALSAEYYKEENTERFFEDEDVQGKYVSRSASANALIEVEPGVGIGKTIDVTPVFLALELEDELKKCGAINFSLADQTIVRMALLLAQNRSYTLRDRSIFLRFKQELDSIIGEDMAGSHKNFRYLGPFAVQRIILRKTPLYFKGAQWRIFAREQLLLQGRYVKRSYPYDNADDETDTDTRYPHHVELNSSVDWGIPLSERLFLNTSLEKLFLTGKNGVEFYDGGVDWGKLIAYDLQLAFSWWPALWFHATLGVEKLPIKGLLPVNDPLKSYLRTSVFVEDNVAIQLDFSFNRVDGLPLSYQADNSLFAHDGFGITLSAFYGF